ncbi:J domain-containing protein [Sandaracinobacteroides saxicola]|uniref:TerB family tellurite resistance protein n=1 Tax=Sandaracinobacteroides saxicola TaxID=2759707 RepID=A0A7G5IJJ2_9SPHN|nr:DnaJ family molecular chaperone [Sandaracinobacteroides saxicola]QMW23534.1 TerB family tellurite resistance protein [Sandaracinobacteroides saxicola]
MAIWALILGTAAGLALGGPLGALAGAAIGGGIDRAIAVRRQDPQRAQVAFTIAAIALAAKMARADGFVSANEFASFQRLFHVPEAERANAERFYRTAQQSVAGYESYARQAAELLGPASPVLEDLLEALLLIATVDGVHPDEIIFLDAVAVIFGFSPRDWARIKARHIASAPDDPWVILGIPAGSDDATIRAAWRALVKQHHPDRHIAEGTPPEFIRVAEARMAAINAAYAALTKVPA